MRFLVWHKQREIVHSFFCPELPRPLQARQWYEGLLKAIESLSEMPKRCPLARENKYFSQEIRQLIYGRGRNSYRILFTIIESNEVATVRILHIRHAAQQTIGDQESDEV
ncbi:MAG: type II toxin-antitoxin system RelE/ParE family toxin [Crinalium sp.]